MICELNEQLSTHFQVHELVRSETAARACIDNLPATDEHLENLRRVCLTVLEPCRSHFGKPIRPNGGYRCPELLPHIPGASPTSSHCLGLAVDFEIAGVSNVDLARFIRSHLVFDQVILEMYDHDAGPNSGWVHVGLGEEMRQQALTMRREGGAYQYKEGILASDAEWVSGEEQF